MQVAGNRRVWILWASMRDQKPCWPPQPVKVWEAYGKCVAAQGAGAQALAQYPSPGALSSPHSQNLLPSFLIFSQVQTRRAYTLLTAKFSRTTPLWRMPAHALCPCLRLCHPVRSCELCHPDKCPTLPTPAGPSQQGMHRHTKPGWLCCWP